MNPIAKKMVGHHTCEQCQALKLFCISVHWPLSQCHNSHHLGHTHDPSSCCNLHTVTIVSFTWVNETLNLHNRSVKVNVQTEMQSN
jgi:hypothetical protein